jgi:hypothetical protein
MTTNQQRAAQIWDHIGDGHSFFEGEGVIAAALDEAEERGRAEALREAAKPDCPLSERVDGPLHSWRFDGDDPYVTCVYCDQMQDARTGRVIRQGRTTDDLPPAPDVSQMRVTFATRPRASGRCWRCDLPPTPGGDPMLCDQCEHLTKQQDVAVDQAIAEQAGD